MRELPKGFLTGGRLYMEANVKSSTWPQPLEALTHRITLDSPEVRCDLVLPGRFSIARPSRAGTSCRGSSGNELKLPTATHSSQDLCCSALLLAWEAAAYGVTPPS